MGTTSASLTDRYLRTGASETSPLEFRRAEVEAFLAQSAPGTSFEQVLARKVQRPEVLSLLAGALPFRVISVQGEYPLLPDSLKHQLKVSASDEAGTSLLEVTVPLHRLLGKRALFGSQAGSEVDQQLISEAGGLYRAPASAVQLRPFFRVDGMDLAIASRTIGLGARHPWSLELLLPGGVRRKVQNTLIVGNFVALGLGGPRNKFVEPVTPLLPLELKAGRSAEFLRLSGFEGSFQEARTLAEGTGEEAVSAVLVLQEAYRRGAEVLALTPANAAALLPRLQVPLPVRAEVEDLLARGYQVTIPAENLALRDWLGTGFVTLDEATSEGGYFLSGRISGGQTIVSPAYWTDGDLVEALGSPDRPESTDDRTAVARIVKITSTDAQAGVVGARLERDLAVYVTTAEGVPVAKAPVTFRRYGKSKPNLTSQVTVEAETYETFTDSYGIARCPVYLAKSILDAAISVPPTSGTHRQLKGYNEVTAESTAEGGATVTLAFPFHAIAEPKPAKRVLVGVGGEGYEMLELGVDLPATVVDEYGNLLANQKVSWTQGGAGGRFVTAVDAYSAPIVFDRHDTNQLETATQITSTLGKVALVYVPGAIDVAGSHVTLTASAAPASPGLYDILVRDTDEETVAFVVKAPAQESYSGIYAVPHIEYPVPFVAEVLRPTGSTPPWQPLTGREFGYSKVSISLEVSHLADNGAKAVLGVQTAAPFEVRPGVPGDDDQRVVFFLPFLKETPGIQRAEFTAEVMKTGQTTNLVEGVATYLNSPVGQVEIDTFRRASGTEALVATLPCSAAYASDVEVMFEVNNPGWTSLYAELIQSPKFPGEQLAASSYEGIEQDDQGRFVLPRDTRSLIRLPLNPQNRGGTMTLKVFFKDLRHQGLERLLAEKTIAVGSGGSDGDSLASATSALLARLTVPVLNAESATEDEDVATEKPFVQPASLELCASRSGKLTIKLQEAVLAAAMVTVSDEGLLSLSPVNSTTPMPELTPQQTLWAPVRPSSLPEDKVVVVFEPTAEPKTAKTLEIPLKTKVEIAGPLPIGHTFVKDVSVVDGHLTKQFEDLRLAGRGGALSLSRTYTSHGTEASPLGRGWSHNLRSYVLTDPNNPFRYLVVGGQGGGQAFECVTGNSNCRPQRGFHGSFWAEDRTTASGGLERVYNYRSKDGTVFGYSKLDIARGAPRFWLTTIKDASGNETVLEYGGPAEGHEVVRLYEPGATRYLQLSYAQGKQHALLTSVEVLSNPRAPSRLAPSRTGTSLNVCVLFGYTGLGEVETASRFDASCEEAEFPGAQALRTESYFYEVDERDEDVQNNLIRHVDPNGAVVEFGWYPQDEYIPGQGGYIRFGNQRERVREVREASIAATTFTYSLLPKIVFGERETFTTTVQGPRDGVPATEYVVSPYGASSEVHRPLDEDSPPAVSGTTWDPVHIRPLTERDPRGRETTHRYDKYGNIIERRTRTPVLSRGGPPTEQLLDETGAVVTEVVEKWGFDPSFSVPTCHIDPSGRATTFVVDSHGDDPRSTRPRGTGKLLRTQQHTVRVARSDLLGAATCQVLAAAIANESDPVSRREYCELTTCPGNARRGDLLREIDALGRVREVLRYDPTGKVEKERVVFGGTEYASTERHFDSRGRAEWEKTSRGGETTFGYDGLDRVILRTRHNQKGGSPGLNWTASYYPGGQAQVVTEGELTTTTTLDAFNRPWTIQETGALLPEDGYTTSQEYDLAGNATVATDRRGFRQETTYDFADRPVSVSIPYVLPRPAEPALLSSVEFDAAGNKLGETNLHGFTTRFTMDPLYRVVARTLPPVPGPSLTGSEVTYVEKLAYDLAGNVTSRTDGNGHTSTQAYDFASRLVESRDSVGRTEERAYDAVGNLVSRTVRNGDAIHRIEATLQLDGLNRPLHSTETFALPGGEASTLTRRRAYDDTANITYAQDARGFVTKVELDDLDRPFRQTVDAASGPLPRSTAFAEAGVALELVTGFTYASNGKRLTVTDALGRVTTEVHDALGRLTTRTLPLGFVETFTYDADGRLVQEVDRRGVVREHSYDALGRPDESRLKEDLTNEGAWLTQRQVFYQDAPDTSGLVRVEETDARGAKTIVAKDALGRALSITDPLGKVSLSRYDAKNRVLTQDRRGYTTGWGFDGADRQVREDTFDLGGSEPKFTATIDYDDVARSVTRTDRRGTKNVEVADGLGRIVKRLRAQDSPLEQLETSEFDANGNETRRVDPRDHASAWAYDGANRKVKETRASGTADEAITRWTHDAAGNVLSVKGPRETGVAYDVRTTYDDLNRPVRDEDALGRVTTRWFDASGSKVCEKRPAGGWAFEHGATGLGAEDLGAAACAGQAVTRWAYDEEGKLVSVHDSLGGTHSFIYDAARNLVAKQDANENLTTYAYDLNGRRTAEHQHLDAHPRLATKDRDNLPAPETANPPLGGTLTRTTGYDANGNPDFAQDPLGQQTTRTFGVSDRLELEMFSGHPLVRELPSLESIRYGYDPTGNVTRVDETKLTEDGVQVET
ncbi:MAG: DUF6531 domain-containing protein, partial [Myxococcota bacterium]|nr:DUF6531 domain-containing protein [Myxococcota bacterium]